MAGRVHIWFHAVSAGSGDCLQGQAIMYSYVGGLYAPAMSRHRPNCSLPTLTSCRATAGLPLPNSFCSAPAKPAPTVGSGRKVHLLSYVPFSQLFPVLVLRTRSLGLPGLETLRQ